jgi:hypothetical protein
VRAGIRRRATSLHRHHRRRPDGPWGFLINLSVFLVLSISHLITWLGPNNAEPALPPMLFLFIAWAVVLVFHFRAVRRVL